MTTPGRARRLSCRTQPAFWGVCGGEWKGCKQGCGIRWFPCKLDVESQEVCIPAGMGVTRQECTGRLHMWRVRTSPAGVWKTLRAFIREGGQVDVS